MQHVQNSRWAAPFFFFWFFTHYRGKHRERRGSTANSQQETPKSQVTANGNGLTTLPLLYPLAPL